MKYAVYENVLIIVLTGIGLFTSRFLSAYIIVAGFLMVAITFDSLKEEKSKHLLFGKGILLLIYAVLSGNSIVFLCFLLLKEIRRVYRGIIAILLYIAMVLIWEPTLSPAMIMMRILILGFCYFLFLEIDAWIHRVEMKKTREFHQLVKANISELHEKRLNEELRLKNILVEKNARMVERENISRTIHNRVGHTITAAIMTLDAADLLYENRPEDARKKMNDANERMRGSLEAIRRAVRVLDEDTKVLLVSDLKQEMINSMEEFVMDTRICVNHCFDQIDDGIELPHEYIEFLTGALQELLTNGVKHGAADDFFVSLLGDTLHIRLEVVDNGKSDFHTYNSRSRIEKGFGIKKIISYVEQCGGKAEFCNYGGFKAVIELPIVLKKQDDSIYFV